MDLTQEQWKEKLTQTNNAIILDVRTAQEVAEGKIEGALHHDIFNPQAFMAAVDSFDPSVSYFVYCRSGNRSGQACAVLRSKGIENAFNLMGGVMSWNGPLV